MVHLLRVRPQRHDALPSVGGPRARSRDAKAPYCHLNAAKKQIKGQIGVSCDNRENFALDFAKSYLHYGREKNVADLFRYIDEVTADRLQTVAQDLFNPDRLTTLILR